MAEIAFGGGAASVTLSSSSELPDGIAGALTTSLGATPADDTAGLAASGPGTSDGATDGEVARAGFACNSESVEAGANAGTGPAGVSRCTILATSPVIGGPLIGGVPLVTFPEASSAAVLSMVVFSPAECVRKKIPMPAGAATSTDARQRRGTNASRVAASRPRGACKIPAGPGFVCWFAVPRGRARC